MDGPIREYHLGQPMQSFTNLFGAAELPMSPIPRLNMNECDWDSLEDILSESSSSSNETNTSSTISNISSGDSTCQNNNSREPPAVASHFTTDSSSEDRHCSDKRPPYSYVALITMALESSTNGMMSLNKIYAYIMDKFPFYKNHKKSWQNSIRHNLSLNDCFVKIARGPGRPGKGSYWALHKDCGSMFDTGTSQRRGKKFKVTRKDSQPRTSHHHNPYPSSYPSAHGVGHILPSMTASQQQYFATLASLQSLSQLTPNPVPTSFQTVSSIAQQPEVFDHHTTPLSPYTNAPYAHYHSIYPPTHDCQTHRNEYQQFIHHPYQQSYYSYHADINSVHYLS